MLISLLAMNKNYAEAVKISDKVMECYISGEDSRDLWQELIGAAKRATDRNCGGCNMCCYALSIEEPLHKPAGDMCVNCDEGVGCKIYADRPPVCSSYYCSWLTDDWFGPEWYPAESKMLVQNRDKCYNIVVDKGYPNRWREEPYYSTIIRLAKKGLNDKQFATYVVSDKTYLILPRGPIDVTHKDMLYIPMKMSPDPDDWDVIWFKTMEEGMRYATGMKIAVDATMKLPLVAQRRLLMGINKQQFLEQVA
jgi:hypothetical protein